MKPLVHMTIWCKRGDRVFDAHIWIGTPRKISEGKWECEWSLGNLLDHAGVTLKSINSMVTMLTSIKFVYLYLKGRMERGDTFYLDSELSEPIEDINHLFPEFSQPDETHQLG